MNRDLRRKLWVVARVAVSIGLLTYLLMQADLAKLIGLWRGVTMPLLLVALALQIGGICVSSFKWWLLLRASDQRVSYWWAARAYFIGTFFSNFLPTMVGGDAVRIYQLNQRTGRTSDAVASVFVERITGFTALTVIAAVALASSGQRLAAAPELFWGALWCILIAAGGVTLALFAPLVARLMMRLRVPNIIDWRGKLGSMAGSLGRFYGYRRTLAAALAISFGYQLSWIATNYAAARALGLTIPFSFMALMVPLSDIIGLVPIFFNSLGAREGTFILLLGLLGTSAEAAVALSLLIFGVRLITSLIGGVLYLVGGLTGSRRGLAEEMEAVQHARLAEKS